MRILYFAPVDWDSIRQRPHHLCMYLSERHDFLYIQPFGLRNLRIPDLGRALGRVRTFFKWRGSGGRFRVINSFFVPFGGRRLEPLNLFILRKQIQGLIGNDALIWATLPSRLLLPLLEGHRYKALIYEMMDDYTWFHPAMEKEIRETEAALIKRADLIITTSAALSEKARGFHPRAGIILSGNGVDFHFFNRSFPERPLELKGMRKIAGYVGSIDDWLDFDTIVFLAEEREDVDFVFIGPIKTDLPRRGTNLHFLGKKDYAEMPRYCFFFDVCLIPFKPGVFADSVDPVKLYEYFALGKPVVACKMRELEKFGDRLYLADDKFDFSRKVALALSESPPGAVAERKHSARQNDWAEKAREIETALLRL